MLGLLIRVIAVATSHIIVSRRLAVLFPSFARRVVVVAAAVVTALRLWGEELCACPHPSCLRSATLGERALRLSSHYLLSTGPWTSPQATAIWRSWASCCRRECSRLSRAKSSSCPSNRLRLRRSPRRRPPLPASKHAQSQERLVQWGGALWRITYQADGAPRLGWLLFLCRRVENFLSPGKPHGQKEFLACFLAAESTASSLKTNK